MSIVNDEARDDNLSEHEGLEAPSKTPSKNSALNVKAAEMPSEQKEMVFALVEGEALTEVPKDLYIPPDALEIFLETFEGPLDLLLYLIKRENLDILEINVADITDQYMAYVELMESSQFELAAEYLVMAAMLAEIKSKILLPRDEEEVEEVDPRMELIRRLQEYERYKQAAENIDTLPRLDRDLHFAKAALPVIEKVQPDPVVDLNEVLLALSNVLRRADRFGHHHIQLETLSTREKMSDILSNLSSNDFTPLTSLLNKQEGRLGVVVTFLAIMELMKDALIEIVQTDSLARSTLNLEAKKVGDFDNKVKMIIEGLLLAASRPLNLSEIAQVFDADERPDKKELKKIIEVIEADCSDRGFELQEVASGYRFQVKQELSSWVGKLWDERPPRYTRALLEILALIAYKQPITRGDIEEIRGVSVSPNIIRTLIDREWVRVVGHRDVPGRPAMFATTKTFLDYFNLKSLQDLPPLSEIKELDNSDSELSLDEELSQSRILDMPDVDDSEGDFLTLSEDELLAEEEAINLSKKPLDEILGVEEPDEPPSTDKFEVDFEKEALSNVVELPVSEKIDEPELNKMLIPLIVITTQTHK